MTKVTFNAPTFNAPTSNISGGNNNRIRFKEVYEMNYPKSRCCGVGIYTGYDMGDPLDQRVYCSECNKPCRELASGEKPVWIKAQSLKKDIKKSKIIISDCLDVFELLEPKIYKSEHSFNKLGGLRVENMEELHDAVDKIVKQMKELNEVGFHDSIISKVKDDNLHTNKKKD